MVRYNDGDTEYNEPEEFLEDVSDEPSESRYIESYSYHDSREG
jgi:hypothetical protein